jgi:hypothetical protein
MLWRQGSKQLSCTNCEAEIPGGSSRDVHIELACSPHKQEANVDKYKKAEESR